jgi:phosphoribosylanthranilate isomerase
MSTKVKICGITNLADALAAVEAGADFLGFVFYDQSPRWVATGKAAAIIERLPPSVLKVGLFVNAPELAVRRTMQECKLDLLQFHGQESPEFCIQFGISSIKAFRVRNAESLDLLANYHTYAWLLDAHSPKAPGGTGETFDWDLAAKALQHSRPVFLAGGLTPDNVASAIRHVRPYAVDVSSGVEATPGRKDHAKISAFLRAAKAALSAQT